MDERLKPRLASVLGKVDGRYEEAWNIGSVVEAMASEAPEEQLREETEDRPETSGIILQAIKCDEASPFLCSLSDPGVWYLSNLVCGGYLRLTLEQAVRNPVRSKALEFDALCFFTNLADAFTRWKSEQNSTRDSTPSAKPDQTATKYSGIKSGHSVRILDLFTDSLRKNNVQHADLYIGHALRLISDTIDLNPTLAVDLVYRAAMSDDPDSIDDRS